MTVKSLILAADFCVALAAAIVSSLLLPRWILNAFAKDVYSIAIGVLAIIFAVFFAALAIIMASTDDEFLKFMQEHGDYTRLIQSLRFTLRSLFTALIIALGLYAYTAYRVAVKVPHQTYMFLVCFTFLFIYSLFASFAATHDAIRYSEYRIKFLEITKRDLSE